MGCNQGARKRRVNILFCDRTIHKLSFFSIFLPKHFSVSVSRHEFFTLLFQTLPVRNNLLLTNLSRLTRLRKLFSDTKLEEMNLSRRC